MKRVSKANRCQHGKCGTAALKGSVPPRCWFHSQDPEIVARRTEARSRGARTTHEVRAGSAAARAQAESAKLWAEIERGIEECAIAEAKAREADEAWKRQFEARGWTLVHIVHRGSLVPCDKPLCWCKFHESPEKCIGDCWQHHDEQQRDRVVLRLR